jgi:hypothetical protein
MLPFFPTIVENVTVSHGRKAVLKCEVENLRNYKVSVLEGGDFTVCNRAWGNYTTSPTLQAWRPLCRHVVKRP